MRSFCYALLIFVNVEIIEFYKLDPVLNCIEFIQDCFSMISMDWRIIFQFIQIMILLLITFPFQKLISFFLHFLCIYVYPLNQAFCQWALPRVAGIIDN